MRKLVISEELIVEVIQNVFTPLSVEYQIDEDGVSFQANDATIDKVINICLNARINAGILPQGCIEIDEESFASCFSVLANNDEKLEIMRKSFESCIPEDKTLILHMPCSATELDNLGYLIIALDLADDQLSAIKLAVKTARISLKVANTTKKVSIIGSASAVAGNKIVRDVTLATVEVGATIGTGLVKTGIEAGACALNIGIKELNPKDLAKGDNVQKLSKTLKSLFKSKHKDNKATTGGFSVL